MEKEVINTKVGQRYVYKFFCNFQNIGSYEDRFNLKSSILKLKYRISCSLQEGSIVISW
jgi:hypothetical protein